MPNIQVTSVSEDEISKILAGNVDSIITPEAPKEEKKEEKTEETIIKEDIVPVLPADFKWSDLEKVDEEEEEKEEKVEEGKPESKTEVKDEGKKGRKPADFVSFINELVEAGDLLPFEDGSAKTIDEAKELIKLNLQQSKEASLDEVKKELKASYSPQIQAILEYADRGGQDITPLMSAIAEVEKTANLDPETESGQVAIVTEYLKATGQDEDEIKEYIETQKDLEKLKEKATKYLPKLNQMKTERIQAMMEEQEEQKKQIEETRKEYLGIIQETLNKDKLADLKLSRPEKHKLWSAVVDTSYRSFNGTPTNAFYKKLEELQVGKTANYDHFLELVYFAVDREGYKNKLKEELNSMASAETAKKLRVQTNKSTANGTPASDEPKKPAVRRAQFRSPYE